MGNQKNINKRNNNYNDDYYAYHRPDRKGGGRHQNYTGDFEDVYSGSKRGAVREFEDITSSSKRGRTAVYDGRRKKRSIARTIISFIFALLIIFVAAIIIFGLQLMLRLNTNQITNDPDELGVLAGVDYGNDITNIALFGLDDRTGTFQGRSDVTMVLSIDQKDGKIKMTSLLRDSLVTIDGYGEDKLNHAYSYGGPELAIKTLNQNFKLDIKDYITVNFYNMAEIVDAFGGTTVTMTDEEAYQTNENLNALMYEQIHDGLERTIWESDFLPKDESGNVKGGTLTLTGNQAVAYARNRTDSDDERAARQQKVMTGLFQSLSDLSIFGYANLANSIVPKCETSLNVPTMFVLAPILLKDFSIETLTVPGGTESASSGYTAAGSWVYIYDRDYAANHINAFIKEEDSDYWDQFYN